MPDELVDVLEEILQYLPFREESKQLALHAKVGALRTPVVAPADTPPGAFTVAQ